MGLRGARIVTSFILVLIAPQYVANAEPITIPSKDSGWLETLNYYRKSSGVEPVTENPAQSAAALKHSIYLAKSDPKYFTGQYENPHTENPESPYYTIEGAKSGTNLTYNSRESEAIDSWMQAPLHAIGLLRDNLKTTGYASVFDERNSMNHTGLDVLNGLVGSKRKIITFPGDGSYIRLSQFFGETPDPRESCGADWKEFRGLPLFASFLNSPPRDISGTLKTPSGETLMQGADLCIVTEYSWVTTDRVIPYGARIMEGDHLVLAIPKLALSPGEHSVTLTGTGMTPLNWKFTVIPPLPIITPNFDLEKQEVSWNPVTVQLPNQIAGYTLIAEDRSTNISKEYRTSEVTLSTKDWVAGEYFLCVQARSLNNESVCDWKYARIFQKLQTVKFSLNPDMEVISWEEIRSPDPNKKISYVVKSRSVATNAIVDYPASGGNFSTRDWIPGDYFVCVMAISPGAESVCSIYFGYKIDRTPKSIKKVNPNITLDTDSITVGKSTYIRINSNVAVNFVNRTANICEMNLEGSRLRLTGLRAGKCTISVSSEKSDLFLAYSETFYVNILGTAPTPKKLTIKCIKNSKVKWITSVKPTCPTGFKKAG